MNPIDRSHLTDRPACLVLHGLGGGPYELAPLIEALEAAGLRVLAPFLPGHDAPGSVMPASTWREWVATAERCFDELAQTGAPVVAIGFSTGAILALRLAIHRPLARLVLLSPFFAIRFTRFIPINASFYVRMLARLFPDLPRRPPAVRDRAMRELASKSDRFRTFNLTSTLSALELIEEVKTLVHRIEIPALIIHGRLDTVVEPMHARWLFERLGSKHKNLITLHHSDHLVVLDRDRDQAIEAILAFVVDHDAGVAEAASEAAPPVG